jgi:hypothetical protein
MKLHLWRKRAGLPRLSEGEEREALQYERRYSEEHGSTNAIFKKMGRENLDDLLKRD